MLFILNTLWLYMFMYFDQFSIIYDSVISEFIN